MDTRYRQRPSAHLILLTNFESFAGHAPDVIPLFCDVGRDTEEKFIDTHTTPVPKHAHPIVTASTAAGGAAITVPQHAKSSVVLGRGSINRPVDFVLSAKSNIDGVEIISRHQARISSCCQQGQQDGEASKDMRPPPPRFVLEDLKSLNGVFVNHLRVDAAGPGVVLQGELS